MNLAAIDIGTNSLHMILVHVGADGAFEVIGREKDMVRLGAGGLEGRPLSEGAMTAALQTLARFKRLAESRNVDEIVAVATSAVREAPNGGDFLATVAGTTGIQARVITGVEEARLSRRHRHRRWQHRDHARHRDGRAPGQELPPGGDTPGGAVRGERPAVRW